MKNNNKTNYFQLFISSIRKFNAFNVSAHFHLAAIDKANAVVRSCFKGIHPILFMFIKLQNIFYEKCLQSLTLICGTAHYFHGI